MARSVRPATTACTAVIPASKLFIAVPYTSSWPCNPSQSAFANSSSTTGLHHPDALAKAATATAAAAAAAAGGHTSLTGHRPAA